jgi:hypothetical protein
MTFMINDPSIFQYILCRPRAVPTMASVIVPMQADSNQEPPQGGRRVMLRMPLHIIMISSVDPRYLRICRSCEGANDDMELMWRELRGHEQPPSEEKKSKPEGRGSVENAEPKPV